MSYPAVQSPNCCASHYDPRLRAWYSAAASGPKTVYLIIDRSGSMNEMGRWPLAVDAAKSVVNSLAFSDKVSVHRGDRTSH